MLGKYKLSIILLLILILLTVGTFLQANDLSEVLSALSEMSLLWLALGILSVLLFVIMEGVMIWYLLRSFQKGIGLCQCISWSFVGFFVSGITPSATGGQPMQIYYMKRAGIQVSASMPVLMILAVLYKLVMVGIGIGICLFWSTGIAASFGDYLWLFYLGLGLNSFVVVLLTVIMIRPNYAEKIVLKVQRLLTVTRILKVSPERQTRWLSAIAEYQQVINFFRGHKATLFSAALMTLIQRSLPFLLTWIIYRGLGLSGIGILSLMALQAAVTLSVDLLPLPGSMGISELVFSAVFAAVFSEKLLPAALCISRGISFYLIMIVSAAVFAWVHFSKSKVQSKEHRNFLV
ncbi:lysylphosphatidylglycerol synthase transmembrane domain-containing protein [Enterococcus sp. DIV0756]|uniref:lysylphosphatidylglycerol synthase transmembrane domain-containing protein n=1 Tax=Enterococcus sp. DIV0756 TaxID=2774636 RepID=UPI003F277F61